MRRVVPILLTASRVLAILAMLAGLAVGLLAATAGAGLICIDTFPPQNNTSRASSQERCSC